MKELSSLELSLLAVLGQKETGWLIFRMKNKNEIYTFNSLRHVFPSLLEVEDFKIMENDIDTSCRDMGAWDSYMEKSFLLHSHMRKKTFIVLSH